MLELIPINLPHLKFQYLRHIIDSDSVSIFPTQDIPTHVLVPLLGYLAASISDVDSTCKIRLVLVNDVMKAMKEPLQPLLSNFR